MREIRQFEDERRAWDVRRSALEEEILRLRDTACAPPANFPGAAPAEVVQAQHRQQLALLGTIDDLKLSLREEQGRMRTLQDRLGSKAGSEVSSELTGQAEDGTEPEPECRTAGSQSAGSSQASVAVRVELLRIPRFASFVLALEDEGIRLREALNDEKQRVLDLKRADQERRAAWKVEIRQLETELCDRRELEERCRAAEERSMSAEERAMALDWEVTQFREQKAHRYTQGSSELEQLKREARERETSRRQLCTDLRHAELESQSLKAQLVRQAAEAVVQQQAQAPPGSAHCQAWGVALEPQRAWNECEGGRPLSELVVLFLGHTLEPLAGVARACEAIGAKDGQRCPPLPDVSRMAGGHVAQLTRLLLMLRFFAHSLAGVGGGRGAPVCWPRPVA